jgi:hypothetical protein
MNDFDPETGIAAYMHCVECISECPPNQSPAQYARLSIGASPNGDLIVWCNRHSMAVTRMRNDEIGQEFFRAGSVECSCCGKGERTH